MAVRTIEQVKNTISDYTSLLLKAGLPVEKIILFGSYARKNANDNSDIDLAVIFRELNEDKFSTRLKLMKCSRDFDEVIEPHPFLN